MKWKVGYALRREVEMRDSTARSVSVTRSTATKAFVRYIYYRGAFFLGGNTVLLRARRRGRGFGGYDAFARAFGDGDHQVVDFLQVEVGHFCNVVTERM